VLAADAAPVVEGGGGEANRAAPRVGEQATLLPEVWVRRGDDAGVAGVVGQVGPADLADLLVAAVLTQQAARVDKAGARARRGADEEEDGAHGQSRCGGARRHGWSEVISRRGAAGAAWCVGSWGSWKYVGE